MARIRLVLLFALVVGAALPATTASVEAVSNPPNATCGDLSSALITVGRDPIIEENISVGGVQACRRRYPVSAANSSGPQPVPVAAVGYPCSPGVTGKNSSNESSAGCGAGVPAVANAFKGISALDSIKIPNCTATSGCYLEWTAVGASCSLKGTNDVMFKNPKAWGYPLLMCNLPLVGYGLTDPSASVTETEVETLGDSGCVTQTDYNKVGDAVVSYTTTLIAGGPPEGTCQIYESNGQKQFDYNSFPDPKPTFISDGTLVKIGAMSCYAKTYKGKTTWISTNGSICPPR